MHTVSMPIQLLFLAFTHVRTRVDFTTSYPFGASSEVVSNYTSFVRSLFPAASARLKNDSRVESLCNYEELSIDVSFLPGNDPFDRTTFGGSEVRM